MEKLTSILIEKDKCTRLPDHAEVKRIQLGIESVLKTILYDVTLKDKRLKGKLLPCGSYYSDVKIGFPDEFDFLYELDTFVEDTNFAIRPSGFKGCKNLWRTPKGTPARKKVHVFTCNRQMCVSEDGEDDEGVQWLHKVNESYVLDPIGVKNTLYYNIVSVLGTLDETKLPRYLSFDSTAETTFMCGPAVTLFFVWHGRFYKHLKISVDITVCIKATKWEEHFDFLKPDFMANSSCLKKVIEQEMSQCGFHLVPHISDHGHIQWKLSTSYFETVILSRFVKDSHLKQLMRILKSTKEKYLKLPPDPSSMKYESVACLVELYNYYFGKDYGDHKHLVSSYLIKNVVFYLCGYAALDEWNKASLAKLYVVALITLYWDIFPKSSMTSFFISEVKLDIPSYGDILPGFQHIFNEIDSIVNLTKDVKLEDIDMSAFDFEPFAESKSVLAFCKMTKEHIDRHCCDLFKYNELC